MITVFDGERLSVLFTFISVAKIVTKNSVSLKHVFTCLFVLIRARKHTKFLTSSPCIYGDSFKYRVKNLVCYN